MLYHVPTSAKRPRRTPVRLLPALLAGLMVLLVVAAPALAVRTMRGTPGPDRLTARSAQIHHAYGDGGGDRVFGGPAADRLYGEEGPDVVSGRGGNDLVEGGSGDDRMLGGRGRDTIVGGFGHDRLSGGAGAGHARRRPRGATGSPAAPANDVLHGGSANDTISGGDGDDEIFSDSGGDTITAGRGDDVVRVNNGTAVRRVDCGPGDDTIFINPRTQSRRHLEQPGAPRGPDPQLRDTSSPRRPRLRPRRAGSSASPAPAAP